MATRKTKPIITFEKVTYTIKGRNKVRTILNDFNFSIYPGEKTVIYGKSGSGKSSLLQLIIGLKQPTKGKIKINNQLLNAKTVWHLRQLIAYVDQDSTIGEGEKEIKKTIKEYLSFKANKKLALNLKKLNQLLTKFRLKPSILTKTVNELSGGERQRMALVIALLLNRPILLLDEVTSSLDPKNKQIVIEEILSLPQTVISVSHDQIWLNQKGVKIFNFQEKQWLLK